MGPRSVHLLCCLLLSICSQSFCQDQTSQEPRGFVNSFTAGVGTADFHQRDKYLSPEIFSGELLASRISYQVKTETNRHEIDAFFGTGTINSDIQPRETKQYVAFLS